jgi:hypothetical protein
LSIVSIDSSRPIAAVGRLAQVFDFSGRGNQYNAWSRLVARILAGETRLYQIHIP